MRKGLSKKAKENRRENKKRNSEEGIERRWSFKHLVLLVCISIGSFIVGIVGH